MKIVIVGAGIGGLTAALSLHEAGIGVEVLDQAHQLAELGVGINMLPHATKELAALGLLPALDRVGIRTRELIYANRFGQVVWRELRGCDAGYDTPQFSIHRGKLHGVLLRAAKERLGHGCVRTGCTLVDFEECDDSVLAHLIDRRNHERFHVAGDGLIGCDGIHSAVRAILYPREGPALWSGITLWRGAADWPVYEDGRTMLIAGGNAAKFVFYPMYFDPAMPDRRFTNWAVMARTADAGQPPPPQDWSRTGNPDDARAFVSNQFHLNGLDPDAMIAATGTFYECPNCDRDPLPRWSFGRTTLLGDAAHPMYPVGSNGASQAILDARALARNLSSGTSVSDALMVYDAERRPATSEIVLRNREGGPERVIDLIEARAPRGFDDIGSVASYEERKAIVRGYAKLAGYAARSLT